MGGPGSGGRRTLSGPAKDPNALRRARDGKEWTKLPAAGRLDPAPEWPAAIDPATDDEMLKWRDVWTLPQALIWEADRAYDLVAFYVRTYLHAMGHRASAQHQTLVRQLSNDLFLAPMALASGRYVIEGTPEAMAIDAAIAIHDVRPKGRPRKGSARDRLTVVQPEPDEDDDDSSTAGGKPETDSSGEAPPF